MKQIDEITDRVRQVTRQMGLQINQEKIHFIRIGPHEAEVTLKRDTICGKMTFKEVKKYVCLGAISIIRRPFHSTARNRPPLKEAKQTAKQF